MLPALAQIAGDLGARGENDRQAVISVLFLGLAAAQMIYGPISDSIGRKPAIYAGFGIFLAGCLISSRDQFSHDACGPPAARHRRGGAAHSGRRHGARPISWQRNGKYYVHRDGGVHPRADHRSSAWPIRVALCALAGDFRRAALVAAITLVWHVLRQPETLPSERRLPFSLRRIAQAIAETFAAASPSAIPSLPG